MKRRGCFSGCEGIGGELLWIVARKKGKVKGLQFGDYPSGDKRKTLIYRDEISV